MNFEDHADEISQLVRKDTVDRPPPPGKPVFGPCWIPICCITGLGEIENRYTTVRFHGETIGAHALATSIVYGTMPEPGIQTLHGCDLKCCRNPGHMRRGTGSENIQDAFSKGLIPFPSAAGRPKGENHRRATMPDKIAAEIKWCFQNEDLWYFDQIRALFSPVTALAIIYKKSPHALVKLKQANSWVRLAPKRPSRLPCFEDIPAGAVAPKASKKRLVSDQDVADLLLGYASCDDKLHYVSKAVARLKCSDTYIRAILTGKCRKKVKGDIPRIDLAAEARKRTPDKVIQAIRATWNAYKAKFHKRGLLSAMARKFQLSKSFVRWVCDGIAYPDVPEDPNAVIPLEELPFLPLTQKGANHKLAKLNDEKVYQILQRLKNGAPKAVLAKEYKVSIPLIYNIEKGKTWPRVWERFQKDMSPPPAEDSHDKKL